MDAGPAVQRALRHVARLSAGPPIDPRSRVTVNFHPDRPTRDGLLVVEALARDGVYRSQFVTGTSNGGLTAHPGGDRWVWEQRLFGGAYDDEPVELRPVYGTLDFRADPAGGAPRFGSAHLRLGAAVLRRTTFCHPDSVFAPTDFGVAERMGLVALAEARRPQDPLDDYIEAHVHGPVRLDRDVEAIVLDPAHRGTAVEAAAARLGCPVRWHPGFRLTVAELRRHPDYRGPQHTALEAELAVDGVLDPRILGAAWRSGRHDAQDLKRVWHLLARFGRPGRRGNGLR
ncbi:DUF3626 domain-containing protein [Pseudonocardia humida]|uniref:DUF3626 domain-containing protein n=1 Tax=Pseudonocardia humida TaxID=2800819 RepID=A0ABT1A3K7_9PSEU|nr:DUF3626 domain-containing protein [Pseudonocardia humida]MCO1657394.1 DUF3626 domain-containing protein [Pseudonocardia humida]